MSTITLTHIGGPTTLIEVEGWRILTDPTFDAPGRTYRFGWGTSSRKTTGPAIPAAELGPIDAVLLTHEHHADNLDDAGRSLLPGVDRRAHDRVGARRLGANARGMRNWDTTRLEQPGRPTITVTATPCRHGPRGSHPIVGDVIGFALTWDGQRARRGVDLRRHRRSTTASATSPTRIDVGTAILHLGASASRSPVRSSTRWTSTTPSSSAGSSTQHHRPGPLRGLVALHARTGRRSSST